jgi:hypothetical protein
MPNALALAIQDYPIFRGPEVSIRHDPGYGIVQHAACGMSAVPARSQYSETAAS